MENRRTLDERIEELKKKRAQLLMLQNQLAARNRTELRKKRNHRIFTLGGLIEKYCGGVSPETLEKYLNKYSMAICAMERAGASDGPPEENGLDFDMGGDG